MAKIKSIYTCQSCGHTTAGWLGRCPGCDEWNTIVEERVRPGAGRGKVGGARLLRAGASVPVPITLAGGKDSGEQRQRSTVGELDRVLGGGVVRGSCVLVGGEPGIGKSTLLLQAMGGFAEKGLKALYITGEESTRQIALRGARLGVLSGASSENLIVWAETSVETIIAKLEELKPGVVVVDSVQTLYSDTLESSPGSVGQVRESSMRLINAAKALEIPLFLVGHVTKDGAIAGPRVLEHMVDTVLYFEGDSGHMYRILRAVKNRFGSVMEIGVFEMRSEGLIGVENPSEVFLAERPEGVSGSAVVPCLEGSRTLLVELQSLVSPSVFGMPRRTVVGVDNNKVQLLIAVLEKKASITLANHDIFVKVAGGIRVDEPAADLGIVASLASNFMDRAVDPGTVVFGEVGLAGELRAVARADMRVKEAGKLGFKRCILPVDNLKGAGRAVQTKGVELTGVSNVKEAIDALFV